MMKYLSVTTVVFLIIGYVLGVKFPSWGGKVGL